MSLKIVNLIFKWFRLDMRPVKISVENFPRMSEMVIGQVEVKLILLLLVCLLVRCHFSMELECPENLEGFKRNIWSEIWIYELNSDPVMFPSVWLHARLKNDPCFAKGALVNDWSRFLVRWCLVRKYLLPNVSEEFRV